MLRQLNLTDLLAGIKQRIEEGTQLTAYDHVPENEPSPLVFIEMVQSEPADTKTMFCKLYTVYLHVIAEPSPSSVPVNNYIQAVQEAMTEDIELPSCVHLVWARDDGVQTIKDDETGEKHAVLAYSFKIAYGFKTK